jgi:hypothetical protein
MKKSKRRTVPTITAEDWYVMARATFPELALEEFDRQSGIQVLSACEDLAWLADRAHETRRDDENLQHIYGFIRWSIRNTDDERLKGWISDWFFDRILSLATAKTSCIEYLDWGDVELLCAGFTVEPGFDDIENFDRLCMEWKRRWSRNQKLAPPTEPAESKKKDARQTVC